MMKLQFTIPSKHANSYTKIQRFFKRPVDELVSKGLHAYKGNAEDSKKLARVPGLEAEAVILTYLFTADDISGLKTDLLGNLPKLLQTSTQWIEATKEIITKLEDSLRVWTNIDSARLSKNTKLHGYSHVDIYLARPCLSFLSLTFTLWLDKETKGVLTEAYENGLKETFKVTKNIYLGKTGLDLSSSYTFQKVNTGEQQIRNLVHKTEKVFNKYIKSQQSLLASCMLSFSSSEFTRNPHSIIANLGVQPLEIWEGESALFCPVVIGKKHRKLQYRLFIKRDTPTLQEKTRSDSFLLGISLQPLFFFGLVKLKLIDLRKELQPTLERLRKKKGLAQILSFLETFSREYFLLEQLKHLAEKPKLVEFPLNNMKSLLMGMRKVEGTEGDPVQSLLKSNKILTEEVYDTFKMLRKEGLHHLRLKEIQNNKKTSRLALVVSLVALVVTIISNDKAFSTIQNGIAEICQFLISTL